jgi:hypothetical protein
MPYTAPSNKKAPEILRGFLCSVLIIAIGKELICHANVQD